MKNYIDDTELPMGFSMALAKNIDAMKYFSELTPEKKKAIIAGTHQVNSRQEMHQYVENMINRF